MVNKHRIGSVLWWVTWALCMVCGIALFLLGLVLVPVFWLYRFIRRGR